MPRSEIISDDLIKSSVYVRQSYMHATIYAYACVLNLSVCIYLCMQCDMKMLQEAIKGKAIE